MSTFHGSTRPMVTEQVSTSFGSTCPAPRDPDYVMPSNVAAPAAPYGLPTPPAVKAKEEAMKKAAEEAVAASVESVEEAKPSFAERMKRAKKK